MHTSNSRFHYQLTSLFQTTMRLTFCKRRAHAGFVEEGEGGVFVRNRRVIPDDEKCHLADIYRKHVHRKRQSTGAALAYVEDEFWPMIRKEYGNFLKDVA